MQPIKHSGKAVWIGAIAAAIAVLLLIILFTAQSVPNEQESIVLPSEEIGSEQDLQQDPTDSTGNRFVTVTNENVSTVLQTMSRPVAYHQAYTVRVGNGETARTSLVELWVNSGIMHAEVTDDQQMRSVITDGQTVHLWYADTPGYLSLELDENMTPEDILGLPDMDSYLHIPSDSVLDAGYLAPEGTNVPCIYVCVRTTQTQLTYHWVDLETGLLYRSNAAEGEKQVYSIEQTDFDLLAVEDETFSDRFALPDGTKPFTVTAETLPQ